jgi:hypothetical protein
MTATRSFPDEVTDPAGIAGDDYASRVKTEGDALWNGVITQVGSVAGTANAITGVSSPPLTADPANGQTFRLTPGANNTTAVTINLDGRGAIALKDIDGSALVADDIVSGRPIEFQRQGASGNYRLTQPTQRALLAAMAASIAASTEWELLGSSNDFASTPALTYEVQFTVGGYSKILVVFGGLSPANSKQITVDLRNSSAAVVSLTDGVNGTTRQTGQAEFIIDTQSGTKVHYGRLISTLSSPQIDVAGNGSSATAPDRVRIYYGTVVNSNMVTGKVRVYGLKV